MSNTVLILAPHPDDEAIGCGGVIGLHRQRADQVHVAFLTSGERGIAYMAEEMVRTLRENEARTAASVLDLSGIEFFRLPDERLEKCSCRAAELLKQHCENLRPDLIYLPHPSESHADHAAVWPIVRAMRRSWPTASAFPTLLAYEVWSPMTRPGWVEDISGFMKQKLQAIRCYRSQLAQFRYDRAIRGLNAYRGALGGQTRFAEAFAFLESSHGGRPRSDRRHRRTGEKAP